MKCETCGGKTMVTDSHLTTGNVRRRWRKCMACGETTKTFETKQEPVGVDLTIPGAAPRFRARYQAMSPEQRKAFNHRKNRRSDAKREAQETGEPVEAIYRRWGVE